MLKEASMNISMTGNTSSEVLELMAILKNAGLDTAHLVTDTDINQPMPDEGGHMCPACAAAHSMDTPCGEAIEEEYANSPDEEYQDDSYMLQDLSGGLNRKKDKGALRAKDPAITYEQKLKAQLKKNLYEKYEQLDEFSWNDVKQGFNKATDTVSGWFNGGDDQQQQQQQSKPKAKKKQAPKQIKTNADRVANYDARINKIKNAPEDFVGKLNTNGNVVELTKDQYVNYLEQQRDHFKNGGTPFNMDDAKMLATAQKVGAKNKGAEDAEKKDQTQSQKVSAQDNTQQQATDDQQQAAPETPPADNTQQAAPETPPADNTQQAAPETPADNTQQAAPTGDPELSGGTTNPQAGPPPTPPANQQAPDSGGPGDGWMANADTDVRNKNINTGAKPPAQQAPAQQAPAQQAPAQQAAPKQAAPKQAAPKQAAPKQAAPKQAAPKQAPAQQAPAQQAAGGVPQNIQNVTQKLVGALQRYGMNASNIANFISSFAK